MKKSIIRFLALGLLQVLPMMPVPSLAQANRVRVSGNIQSADHQVVPGATITVVHLPSGTQRKTSADASGSFALANVAVGGPYRLQIEQPNYQPKTLEGVYLSADKPAVYTIVLSTPAPTQQTAINKPAQQTTQPNYSPSRGGSGLAQPVRRPPTWIQQAVLVTEHRRPVARKAYVRKPSPKGVAPAVSGHFDAKTGNYIYETGTPTTLKLPDGKKLEGVGSNSTESNLFRFLTAPAAQIDTVDLTKGWLNFDRVYFDNGKATLTKESINQLRNVAALLRAFPKSRVKIGGYTDSLGTYKLNKNLSEARARTAWAALVDMGISPARIDARGYGPRYAIADNNTEEGRAMNRRLSIKVLAK